MSSITPEQKCVFCQYLCLNIFISLVVTITYKRVVGRGLHWAILYPLNFFIAIMISYLPYFRRRRNPGGQ